MEIGYAYLLMAAVIIGFAGLEDLQRRHHKKRVERARKEYSDSRSCSRK